MKSIGRLWASLRNQDSLRWGLLLFFIAFFVRLAFILVFHPYRDLVRYELERTAISLAHTGVYGNPYAIPTGPTAHVAPGYTLVLAALFRIFGTGIPAEIVKEILSAMVSSLGCALLPAMARSLALDIRAGVLAGAVSALYPATPLIQIDGDWEAPYTALALMLVSVVTVKLWKGQNTTKRNALIHGVAWGMCLLFVPALLPLFMVFVIASVYFCRSAGVQRCLTFTAVEVLIVALFLTPWVIRNSYALGALILTRSNFGLELRVSNNDLASPDQQINYINGVSARYHPYLNSGEALKVRELGEVEYNRQAGNEAKQWIRLHPRHFLELCLGRMRCFWLYRDQTSRVKTLFLNATVLLGWAGLVVVFRTQPVTGIALFLMLLIYPLPNYLVHVGLRQEYPVEWLMTLLSGVLVLKLTRREAQAVTTSFSSFSSCFSS